MDWPRHLLVFEPGADGHAREWLWHLLGHMLDWPTPERVTFAVSDEMLAELEAALPTELDGRIGLVALGRVEQWLCTHRRLAVSGFSRWWSMRRQLRRAGADHGQFLGLDHLSLPLALGLGFGRSHVSGILFRPSVHYRAIGRYRPGWREAVRDRRKAVLYRLMLRNPALQQLLTLDPYFPAYAKRHYGGGGKVYALPDPVHPLVPIAPADAALAARIPAKRAVFVLFGVLTERKGVLALLSALEQLKPQAAAQAAILLAGRLDPAIRAKVRAQCRRVAAHRPELWLHIEDRHLSPGEICCLVDRSEVVLAPYQRFVGSSGVLLWAAQAGRPLLAQDFGLIGRLVREHRLGLVVDACDPTALATAIGRMLDNGTGRFIDHAAARAFIAARAPEGFAAMVLSGADVSPSASV